MRHLLLAAICLSTISGCSIIPRGAGVQSEVLAAQNDVDEYGRVEFIVEPVTREKLAIFSHWPTINTQHLHWISRDDQPTNRIIAGGDSISITIWSAEDNGLLLSPGQRSVTLPELRVSPDGKVFLPYIGDQKISGMSPDRARAVIESKYEDITPSAQVQLSLTEGRARTVNVVAGVSSPGTVTLADNDVTILQVLSQTGGIEGSLVNPQVRLQRGGELYGVSADRLLNTPRLDTTLQGGDSIFIEEDDRSFLSLGAAGSQAVHFFPKDRVTALEALTIIGGVSESRADAQGILILRRYPVAVVSTDDSGPSHPRTVFTVDLTSADGLFSADQFEIQPGDLVYVSESPLTAASSILGVIGSVIGLGNQFD